MKTDEILSDEEMSALNPQKDQNDETNQRDRLKQAIPYNFRRPDRLSKEQVRSIYLLHDLLAHSLSSSLPLFMRAVCDVNLISVDQQPYSDYLKGLADPSAIYTISVEALQGVFAIEINSSLAFPIIDRLLGGGGNELSEPRAATDLELNILEDFLEVITDSYEETWKPVTEFETEIIGQETRPQLAQIVSPNEVVATVVYQMQIGESKGTMSICLPVVMLEEVIQKLNPASYAAAKPEEPEAIQALFKNISAIRVPVATELNKVSARFSDLMALSEGDIIRTNHSVQKPLNLSIGEINKFFGKVATAQGRMAVQITGKNEPNSTKAAA
ncbi:MAG: flagellar motor switch protein FliM [Pyrinomonadaceae bacterium]|nr:flagellar motor switch protein FliM [Pyrinomonadaceae bacterium]